MLRWRWICCNFRSTDPLWKSTTANSNLWLTFTVIHLYGWWWVFMACLQMTVTKINMFTLKTEKRFLPLWLAKEWNWIHEWIPNFQLPFSSSWLDSCEREGWTVVAMVWSSSAVSKLLVTLFIWNTASGERSKREKNEDSVASLLLKKKLHRLFKSSLHSLVQRDCEEEESLLSLCSAAADDDDRDLLLLFSKVNFSQTQNFYFLAHPTSWPWGDTLLAVN